MAIDRYSRCGRFVDLDWQVEEIEYINGEAVCSGCLTAEEEDSIDKELT